MIYDSARRGHPAIEELREVFRYRHLIFQLVRRDVLTRYKRSILGVAWTLLNPLGIMLVLTFAFSQIIRVGDIRSYPIYILSGLITWTFFQQTTTAAIVNLVWGGNLLNRIYIPRTSFALAAIGTGLVNLSLSVIPLLILNLIVGLKITSAILFLPVAMLLLAGFALGVGMIISSLAIYFPDVSEMYQIVLTAWFYLTPIIYPEAMLSNQYHQWFNLLNPMVYFVRLFRLAVYDSRFPSGVELLQAMLIAAIALLAGWFVFTKRSDEFAYRA